MRDQRAGSGRLIRLVALLIGIAGAGACSAGPRVAAEADGCASFAPYLGHGGTAVRIFSPVGGVDATKMQQSWEQFVECTGITIVYEGRSDFEATLTARLAGPDAPDMAFLPQPGLLRDLARAGSVKPASAQVRANFAKWWSADWQKYATIDGVLYAAPLTAAVKSFVWYSPKMFTKAGHRIPETWDEMLALSDRIAAAGVTPWCAGIESGKSTGWPATDWLEDALLRESGIEVYDLWVNHGIPFDDPRIVSALDRVGRILRNPAYVNGGYGDVKSIATTAFQVGGLPIMEGKCAMHRQASFYLANWPEGATIAADGDIFAFPLPPIDPAGGRPVLGAADFVGTFNERPEVQAVAAYLSTPEWANSRAVLGGMVSANKGVVPASMQTPIEKLSAQLLIDPAGTFRFDGSDMMPAAVGAGTFWSGMTDWINGADTATVLARIESTWPR